MNEVNPTVDTEAKELREEIGSRLNNLTAKQLLEFIAEVNRLLSNMPESNNAK